LRRQLEKDVEKMNITHSVSFIDEVSFSAVPSYLFAADIFVTASDSEVHPLTVIEAMAAGLPVVGRFEKGLNETVQHGTNGFIKSRSDEEAAADIVNLASNLELRGRMGMASRQISKQFHIQNTIDQSIEIYYKLLDSPSTARAPRSSGISRHSLLTFVVAKVRDASRKPNEYYHGPSS
jgi:1,2-diacylglycerol 3-alpha-glucosyltransferase